MKNINGVKIGNVVNVSINGKLHKKNCGSTEEANELFRLVLTAKADPTDDNVKAIRAYLNEKTRIALLAGLETDLESGEVYLAGFNTPLPMTLVDVIKEYYENDYPLDAIINFWKLLMDNTDIRVREDLFDFITTHDFVLTDAGYMVVYKAVHVIKDDNVDTEVAEFVSRQYLHIKKDWKCSPNKYVAYKTLESDELKITKQKTAKKWLKKKESGVVVLGKIGELFDSIFTADEIEDNNVPTYTDMHTHEMSIKLGEPVRQARKECDADPRKDCSNGLHVGATSYVERFAGGSGVVLVCYVNPAHVVAVPEYDHSKMRVCEYFPFAIANYEDNKIDVIEQAYFESDYCEYEIDELEKRLELLQKNEKPIETAINAEEDIRPMSELKKIIESRLIDIE